MLSCIKAYVSVISKLQYNKNWSRNTVSVFTTNKILVQSGGNRCYKVTECSAFLCVSCNIETFCKKIPPTTSWPFPWHASSLTLYIRQVKVIDLCWAFYCCIESPVIGIVFQCKHGDRQLGELSGVSYCSELTSGELQDREFSKSWWQDFEFSRSCRQDLESSNTWLQDLENSRSCNSHELTHHP